VAVVKKALVLAVVVVVVVTGLPVLMGMSGMATCHDCPPASAGGPMCILAVLTAGLAFVLGFGPRARDHEKMLRLRLHAFFIERPPRLA